jgi:hypothetical protein
MKSDKPVPENVPNKEGFSEEDIERAFIGAGLETFHIDQFSEAKFHGQMVNVFLAKGTKPNVTVE